MLLTQRIFKPVILALLVLLSFGATAGADAEKKCFEYSDLPSLPNKATVECAWGFPDGLAAVQADKLFVLKDGAEKWVQVDSGPLGIGASAITTSAAGKLYVVDGVKVFTLGFAEDTLELVRTELADLPVAVRKGDAEVIVDEVDGVVDLFADDALQLLVVHDVWVQFSLELGGHFVYLIVHLVALLALCLTLC